jgi:hypothetical protein
MVFRAPVDDVLAPVDQSFFKEPDEHLTHRCREALVHGEPFTVPITRGPQLSELPYDDPAVLLPPFPYPLDELLPP